MEPVIRRPIPATSPSWGGHPRLGSRAELQRRHPTLTVCVLERENRIAAHQTSHNSGVLHAGLYYTPGSLKARLCREGADAMYRFCDERGLPHERCGKVVVATELAQVDRLADSSGAGMRTAFPACGGSTRTGSTSSSPTRKAWPACTHPRRGSPISKQSLASSPPTFARPAGRSRRERGGEGRGRGARAAGRTLPRSRTQATRCSAPVPGRIGWR